MQQCNQTQNQTVLEHGESVQNYLFDLINHLRTDSKLNYEWKLPEWIKENKELILSSLPDDETLKLYTLLHDCGKPFCRTVDEDGKVHFPNHAEVSYEVFKQVSNNELAAELIRHDMDIHTLKADQFDDWFSKNKDLSLVLLLTSLAEVHSNANMFGGLESISFKIKLKSITQRGKQIFNELKTKQCQK